MDNSFFAYLQQLELIAFFSGYPLVYAIILFFTGKPGAVRGFSGRIFKLLPFAYALTGTLYLGLQLRNLYPDYTIENIRSSVQQPLLITWAILSILFWIPALSKRPIFSLLHSFVFFYFIMKDLFVQLLSSSADKNILRNDMKLYTDSLLLNLGTFGLMVLFSFLYMKYKRNN